MKKCLDCNKFLEGRGNNVTLCKKCQKEHRRVSNTKGKLREHAQNRRLMNELKINGCAICGYDKCVTALDFHHVNPQDKAFPVTASLGFWKKNEVITEEINKCILLCSNCHRELHYNERSKE